MPIISLVLLDLSMLEIDGEQTFHAIQAIRPDTTRAVDFPGVLQQSGYAVLGWPDLSVNHMRATYC